MAAVSLSSAQDATGRILGTAYDQQAAVIAGARITVTNTATHVTRTATTDNQGYFQVLALPIGNYTVTAEHNGFRTVISQEERLLINQALRIDIKMEVGTASEKVEVGAEAAPVETVNATLGQSVTGRVLTNMPLNGRDALDLALLQPGVTTHIICFQNCVGEKIVLQAQVVLVDVRRAEVRVIQINESGAVNRLYRPKIVVAGGAQNRVSRSSIRWIIRQIVPTASHATCCAVHI